eukprot:scaffold2729_cov403-Prasinococcus_capsulatus_cf.AAC.11
MQGTYDLFLHRRRTLPKLPHLRLVCLRVAEPICKVVISELHDTGNAASTPRAGWQRSKRPPGKTYGESGAYIWQGSDPREGWQPRSAGATWTGRVSTSSWCSSASEGNQRRPLRPDHHHHWRRTPTPAAHGRLAEHGMLVALLYSDGFLLREPLHRCGAPPSTSHRPQRDESTRRHRPTNSASVPLRARMRAPRGDDARTRRCRSSSRRVHELERHPRCSTSCIERDAARCEARGLPSGAEET